MYFYSLTFRFLFLRQGPQVTNYATIPMIIYKITHMDILCDFFFFFQVRVDDSQERCEYSCVVEGQKVKLCVLERELKNKLFNINI